MGSYSPQPAKTFANANPFGQSSGNALYAANPVAQAPQQTTFSSETWSSLPGLNTQNTTPTSTAKADPFSPFGTYYQWNQSQSKQLGAIWDLFPEDKRKQIFNKLYVPQ